MPLVTIQEFSPEEETRLRETRLIKNVNGFDVLMSEEEERETRERWAIAEAESKLQTEKQALQDKINAIETAVTPRRLREALVELQKKAGITDSPIIQAETQIAALRPKPPKVSPVK